MFTVHHWIVDIKPVSISKLLWVRQLWTCMNMCLYSRKQSPLDIPRSDIPSAFGNVTLIYIVMSPICPPILSVWGVPISHTFTKIYCLIFYLAILIVLICISLITKILNTYLFLFLLKTLLRSTIYILSCLLLLHFVVVYLFEYFVYFYIPILCHIK